MRTDQADTAVEPASTKDYAMLAHVVDEGGFDAVNRAVRAWLRNRHSFNIRIDSSGEYTSKAGQVSALLDEGGTRTMRVQFNHDSPTGVWSTEILNHAYPDRPGWVRLTVRNAQGNYAKVPGLARDMAKATTLKDGPVLIGAAVQVLTEVHVPPAHSPTQVRVPARTHVRGRHGQCGRNPR